MVVLNSSAERAVRRRVDFARKIRNDLTGFFHGSVIANVILRFDGYNRDGLVWAITLVLGIIHPGGLAFWSFLAQVTVRHPGSSPRAIALAIYRFHYRMVAKML